MESHKSDAFQREDTTDRVEKSHSHTAQFDGSRASHTGIDGRPQPAEEVMQKLMNFDWKKTDWTKGGTGFQKAMGTEAIPHETKEQNIRIQDNMKPNEEWYITTGHINEYSRHDMNKDGIYYIHEEKKRFVFFPKEAYIALKDRAKEIHHYQQITSILDDISDYKTPPTVASIERLKRGLQNRSLGEYTVYSKGMEDEFPLQKQ